MASPVKAEGTQHAFNSTLHKTKETADLWIASPDGRKWEEQKLAK
jgi:hypothetical protein